jgi:hypothetical protein
MAVIALSELILREILLNCGVTAIIDVDSILYAFGDAVFCVYEDNDGLLIQSCTLFSIQWSYLRNIDTRVEFFKMLGLAFSSLMLRSDFDIP